MSVGSGKAQEEDTGTGERKRLTQGEDNRRSYGNL